MVATRGTSAPAPSAPTRPTTQENVSLSLVDILEEVQLQVPLESRPQVELLIRLALAFTVTTIVENKNIKFQGKQSLNIV